MNLPIGEMIERVSILLTIRFIRSGWTRIQTGRIPDYFVSASQLTPEDHVRVQATVQNLTNSSISKTVNAPYSYTVEDVKKLYKLAYELGLKELLILKGKPSGVLSKETPIKATLFWKGLSGWMVLLNTNSNSSRGFFYHGQPGRGRKSF